VQPQMAAIVEGFESAQRRMHRLAEVVPEERWAVRSDPHRWSVAECVEHLNLSGRAYEPIFAKVLADGPPRAQPVRRRFRRDFVGWLMGVSLGPLPGVGRFRLGRMRTASILEPSGELARGAQLEEFDRLQAVQTGFARSAEGFPLDAMFIASPINRRIRYSLYSCLFFLPRHQVRHLWQAEQVWRPA